MSFCAVLYCKNMAVAQRLVTPIVHPKHAIVYPSVDSKGGVCIGCCWLAKSPTACGP